MSPLTFLLFYIGLLISTSISLIYKAFFKKGKKKINKIDKIDLLFISILIITLSSWLPWTYNTDNIDSEVYTYEAQARCIREKNATNERLAGFCDRLLYSGEHELTYPILILLAKQVFGERLGIRILVNILNIGTAILLYFLARRFSSQRIIALALALSYFIIPHKEWIILDYNAENVFFLLFFGLLLLVLNIKQLKKENQRVIPIELILLSWLIVFTRIESVLIVPLLITLFLNLRKIKVSLKEYLKAGGISLIFIILFIDLVSEYRAMGNLNFKVFPIPLISLFILDFTINRLFKNRDKIRELIFYSLYFAGALFLLIGEDSASNPYTFSHYTYKLSHYWIPKLIEHITSASISFKLLLIGWLGLLIWKSGGDIIKGAIKKSPPEDSTQECKEPLKRRIGQSSPFIPPIILSLALALIGIQTFITNSFLEPILLDERLIVTATSILFIASIPTIAFLLNIKAHDNIWMTILKYIISIAILILVVNNLHTTPLPIGTRLLLENAFSHCQKNESILYYSPAALPTAILQTKANVVAMPYRPYQKAEIEKILTNYKNICWIERKNLILDSHLNETLKLIKEIILNERKAKETYENSEFKVYSISA